MKAIDLHSHYSTRKGFLFQTPEEIVLQEKTFKCRVVYRTEAEMAQDFRDAGVKSFIDFGFTMRENTTMEALIDLHNYAGQMIATYPDAFLGAWIAMDPRHGPKGIQEFERCLRDLKMTGLEMNPAMLNLAPTDKVYYPYYDLCVQLKAPVLMAVGYTVEGAGLPGGAGHVLEYNHPRYVDEIAAKFPKLTIIAGRQAWPWVSEMIAVLLHKPNVWNELHGWSPKYFDAELKREISHRLQDRFMFGADYPLLKLDRLFADWEAEGYKTEVMEKVYYRNAQRLFRELGREVT